ncbi:MULTISPECIES: hypothetical protein [unclassified Crossiella]|nr:MULTISPECIES: hypothetical protein [unclassified Crossiella]
MRVLIIVAALAVAYYVRRAVLWFIRADEQVRAGLEELAYRD